MSYDPENFTTQSNKAVQAALELARERGHIELTPLHLAYILFSQDSSLGAQLAQKAGVARERLLSALEDALKKLSRQDPAPDNIYPNGAFMRVLKKAVTISRERKDSHTSVDSLLLALFEDADTRLALDKVGLTRKRVEDLITATRGNQGPVTSASAENTYDALKKYAMDLVTMAEEGRLDPVIGRDNEIRRCIQVLSRRTKNNPVLIGEPGVGTSTHRCTAHSSTPSRPPLPSVARVPHPAVSLLLPLLPLLVLYVCDASRRQDRHRRGAGHAHCTRGCSDDAAQPTHLVTGRGRARRWRLAPRRVRGAAEGRHQGSHGQRGEGQSRRIDGGTLLPAPASEVLTIRLLSAVLAQVILFIDELHLMLGAGATQGGTYGQETQKCALRRPLSTTAPLTAVSCSPPPLCGVSTAAMDAANLIKPPLARGELRCIGATTLDEYRKYVEKDAAFERRFQQVLVKQPSVEETISILRGLKEKYESHFGVRITDAALVQAAVLANRYITQRFLPDKAIDVLDEACSAIRVQLDSQPEIIDQLQRRKLQLEVEKLALTQELEAAKKGSSKTAGRSDETDDSDLGIDIAQNKERLRAVNEELNALNDKLGPLLLRYENEKVDTYTRTTCTHSSSPPSERPPTLASASTPRGD